MLVDEVVNKVIELGKTYCVSEIWLFGSRVKGNASNTSDIDIAVSGIKQIDSFQEAIEDIDTLYSIDIINLDTCRNQNLLEDIKKNGRKIYSAIS